MRPAVITIALMVSLAACSDNPSGTQEGDETVTQRTPASITSLNAIKLHLGEAYEEVNGENYGEQMSLRSRAYDEMDWKPIGLAGVECGDNCYILYNPKIEGAGDATALCSAPECAAWLAAGELPDDLRLRGALARFGTGTQYDAAGNVMSTDYPEITALRLDPE